VRLISNVELRSGDVVGDDADVAERDAFAQTMDGYEVWGDAIARMANGWLERWERTGGLPGTLTELRGCLFFEQRRRNHVGEGIETDRLEYENAVFAGIRALLELGVADSEQATARAWLDAHPET
jgi:hypothetical protein